MRLRKTRTFRVRASLDAQLIAAARANHRSVSEEIEHRLERAFNDDDDGFADFCRVFAAAKVDFSMPFEERLARMLMFDAQEHLAKELDLGDKPFAKYIDEH